METRPRERIRERERQRDRDKDMTETENKGGSKKGISINPPHYSLLL